MPCEWEIQFQERLCLHWSRGEVQIQRTLQNSNRRRRTCGRTLTSHGSRFPALQICGSRIVDLGKSYYSSIVFGYRTISISWEPGVVFGGVRALMPWSQLMWAAVFWEELKLPGWWLQDWLFRRRDFTCDWPAESADVIQIKRLFESESP